MSPRKTPLREDSACKLIENSCDQDLLISDLDDDDDELELEDEEIELLVEEGQTPILVNRKQILKNNSNVTNAMMVNPHHQLPATTISGGNTGSSTGSHQWEEYDDESSTASISIRDSFPLGAGCLPCTPKSQKKSSSSNYSPAGTGNKCQHGKSSNWCCGVVANSIKKTTKKF